VQDLLPGREWLSHPLYREVYRPLGLHAHISCALRDTGVAMHSLSLNRAGRDFSDRERERLEEYRRVVRLAWRQLEDRAAMRAVLSSPGDGGAQQPALVFTADPDAPRVVVCNEAMARLLAADAALLDVLTSAARAGSEPAAPIASVGAMVRLTVSRSPDAVVVRVAEVPDAPLTTREQHVLAALAGGGTAHAIGRQLGISERTVQKHLENIYAKIGVHDRLAAVLLAQGAGDGEIRAGRTG
jgi:DNA-binding NarL/FixJ family response regulator